MLQAINNDSPIHTYLKEIASRTDFSDPQRARGALLEAARGLIEAHLGDRFPQKLAENMINDMSQTIASDPVLKQKLASILLQLKNDE